MADEAAKPLPWKILSPSTDWVQRTVVLYGPSGSGKTYLAAQFPDPLLVSCDPGTLGGASSVIDFAPKQVKISSYSELLTLLPIMEANAGKEFKTVIVDSITYLSKLVMKNILTTVGREKPTFDEWGLNYARTAMFINRFAEMKCHVVFTAIDSKSKDEMLGKIMGSPDLPGKLSSELPQAVDIVARLFTTTGYDNSGKLKTNYKFRVVPDDIYFAKDRTRKLPNEGGADFETFIRPLFAEEELTKK